MNFKEQANLVCILRIKLFLRKSSIIFVLNRKKANSIFMKGNSIFSKCALMHHLKMLHAVLQTASKNLKLNYSIQQNKKLGSVY
jgi:hypothetical protein